VPQTLGDDCELLRSLHVPGDPIVLPNAWDVASAKAVAVAGFPAVATTSAGVAAALGYQDHQGAPAEEMLAVAGRISRNVEVPVTVDAEAGYGLKPAELVAALRAAGAAGCNLEDTNHAAGGLREPTEQAGWLRSVREAAAAESYGLVINARIDVFLSAEGAQIGLVPTALERAHAYFDAGADCVYPILLSEEDALATFADGAPGPVNVLASADAPPLARLRELGVARVSYGPFVYRKMMAQLDEELATLAAAVP
jgi:2-methylisocitrate lyase-like PEP mutase family enzyme